MKIHDLKPAEGSRKQRKRVGRGIGGKGGKTAGRGTKGQKARNTIRVGFEGGQLPIQQRLPKLRGFNNPFRVEYQVVNVRDLNRVDASEITPEVMRELGLISNSRLPVKILGSGEVEKAFQVTAHRFSGTARSKIEAAGGSVTLVGGEEA